jgi:hypothetical protein
MATPIDGTGLYDQPGTGTDLQFNGNTNSVAAGVPTLLDADGDGFGAIRLTNTAAAGGQASTVFTKDKVDITGKWTTQFDFQATAVAADGFAFAIQNNSNTFVGGGGGGGAYNGIGANALGIGFDTYDSHSTTGAFIGDNGPTSNDEVNNPYTTGIGTGHGINLNQNNTGVDLHSGRNMRAILTYDGTNLSEMVIDLDDPTRTPFNYNYGAVNLTSVLGGNTAWMGFTGATGGAFENVDIKNWTFNKLAGPTPPHVDPTTPFVVNDGSAQRSLVKSVSVKFDQPNVQLASGALQLIRDNVDATGNLTGTTTDISGVLNAPTSPDGGQTWTWTFVPNSGTDTVNGSLTDGVYHVVVDATKVSTTAGPMAANYTSPKFHRLFGDINGSKGVNAQDYNLFRSTFGKPSSDPAYIAGFDFDSSGTVNAQDYNQFRARFGKNLVYTA